MDRTNKIKQALPVTTKNTFWIFLDDPNGKKNNRNRFWIMVQAGTASTAIRISLPMLSLHLDGFHLCAALRMPWSFVNAES
jgi:hypothetical protein